MKNRTLLWSLLALLVAALVGGWFLWFRPADIKTLVLAQDLKNPKVLEALQKELGEFQSLYPDLRVRIASANEDSDVAILANYPTQPDSWTFPLTPWTGSLWVLAAHRDRLDGLAAESPALVADLRAGTLAPEGFVELLAKAKEKGPAPLTLGNSHLWPFMGWLQAWTAATLGPGAATALPDQLAGPYPTLESPMKELNRWRSLGWFDSAAWPQSWAQGLQPLQKGQAIFALISEPQLTALAPATRAALDFLPFPHRKADGPWSLGNAQFLAVAVATKLKEPSLLLVRYLSSPGVTTRLSQATGRPFFAWNSQGSAPVVLPDWTSRANDPEFQALGKELAN